MESVQDNWAEIPNEALSAVPIPLWSGFPGLGLQVAPWCWALRPSACLAPWRAERVEVQYPGSCSPESIPGGGKGGAVPCRYSRAALGVPPDLNPSPGFYAAEFAVTL